MNSIFVVDNNKLYSNYMCDLCGSEFTINSEHY